MTSRELRRLKRHELLQLLLAQSEEAEETRKKLEETSAELTLTASNYERLRKRLDLKDAQIAELRTAIEEERTKRRIELDEAGDIATAALRLNGVFEAAQAAAEQYLENMRMRQEDLDAWEAQLRAREEALKALTEPAGDAGDGQEPAGEDAGTPDEGQDTGEDAGTPDEGLDAGTPADSEDTLPAPEDMGEAGDMEASA